MLVINYIKSNGEKLKFCKSNCPFLVATEWPDENVSCKCLLLNRENREVKILEKSFSYFSSIC